MSNFDNARAIPAARPRVSVKTVTSLAMLSALTYIAMLLSKLLPQVAGFLQMDVKDTVVCIGGFLFGPLSAAIISIVVALVEMFTVSDTGVIGLIMNMLATCSFCCTASFVYKKLRTRKGAVLGLTLGTLALVAVMLLWNYLITPLYMTGVSRADVAAMLPTVFLPFNLVKGGLNMALILILYKPVVTALRKARLAPERESAAGKDRFDAGFVLFSLALLATFVTLVLVLSGKL
ncbi:MAG: ECF transporter S component [Oscillibacter sp.]|nr:ECF transporter S component [Oscillibacter sp.]